MAQLSPLARVKKEHESKEKLVDKVAGLIDAGDESKGDLKSRLSVTSNKKLLRLFKVGTELKSQFGSKDKLVDQLLTLSNKSKDKDYRAKLAKSSPIALMALHRAWDRHGSPASPKNV